MVPAIYIMISMTEKNKYSKVAHISSKPID